MEDVDKYGQFHSQATPALQNKLEEFSLLGYDDITEEGLWTFLLKKKWKKRKEDIRLYEVIQDILSVKVSDVISYAGIETLKASVFSLNDKDEWKELLK